MFLSPNAQLYAETHDEHFELVIVDYESQDLDVEAELKQSTLKRWAGFALLIGASLSEPHTSVYGGTILLYVRLYVHHTAYALMLQISDNSSHVELTCVFKFTCTST